LAPLAGRPLISYTMDAARASAKLTRKILSTDSEEVILLARSEGIEVPFVRPAELASDEATHVDVLTHALDQLKAQENYQPDWIVLLQPTSPLRSAADIDAAIELAVARDADSV